MQSGHRNAYECIAAFSATDFRGDLAKFDVPTLVIHGDDDQIVPFEVGGKASAALIDGAQLKVYPGAPHGITDTHKEQLNADLLDWSGRRRPVAVVSNKLAARRRREPGNSERGSKEMPSPKRCTHRVVIVGSAGFAGSLRRQEAAAIGSDDPRMKRIEAITKIRVAASASLVPLDLLGANDKPIQVPTRRTTCGQPTKGTSGRPATSPA